MGDLEIVGIAEHHFDRYPHPLDEFRIIGPEKDIIPSQLERIPKQLHSEDLWGLSRPAFRSRRRLDDCPAQVVSSYALLIVVWFEAFLDARRHWLDRNQYRWHFRVAYFGLNVVLVGAMVLLYALIFFSGIDGVRYTYVALAGVSIAAPAAHCALYVTLSLQFAPFPLRGGDDENRYHRSRVVVAWAFGRALWGLIVVTACSQIGTAAALRKDPQLGGVAPTHPVPRTRANLENDLKWRSGEAGATDPTLEYARGVLTQRIADGLPLPPQLRVLLLVQHGVPPLALG